MIQGQRLPGAASRPTGEHRKLPFLMAEQKCGNRIVALGEQASIFTMDGLLNGWH